MLNHSGEKPKLKCHVFELLHLGIFRLLIKAGAKQNL